MVCVFRIAPKPLSLPVEEDDQTSPMESYAMSKVVNEETARAFQRRTDFDVYGLRIGNVIEPDEYGLFADFCATPSVREPNAFNYIGILVFVALFPEVVTFLPDLVYGRYGV